MEVIFFSDQNEFRNWLENYFDKETELLVGYYKVSSEKPSMTWSQSVDQALCFGWIDSIRKSIDSESYCIRFTPRKKSSIWSDVNLRKVAELKKAGLMTEAGLKAFSYRKESSRKIQEQGNTFTLSPDLEKIFKENKPAWEFFNRQPPHYRKVLTRWVMSAKKEATKLSRLKKVINESRDQIRIKLM